MRILYAVHQYLPRHKAGAEVYTHSLAREMARRHEVLVYCHEPALDGGAEPAREETYDGVRVRRVAAYGGAAPGALGAFRASYANASIEADFRRTLARFRPDVLHVQHLKDLSVGLVAAARAAGVPVVMTLHDYWGVCPNAQCVRPGGRICTRTHARLECGRCAAYRLRRPWLTAAAPAMMPLFWARDRRLARAMRDVARFVAPSAFLRERYVAAGYPADRFLVLENGLDVARLRGCAGERPAFRGHYAYLGSLAWQKGVHVLVEAFAALGGGGAELRLWGGPQAFPAYAARLRRLAGERPWIRFEGELDSDRVGEALGWADYLVVPSVWWENSPVTIREAYHCGVPVIASRLGALAEKVQHGAMGLLFAPGDAADLRRTLQRTLEEPELLAALREGLPRTIAMDEHAALLEGVYYEVLREES